MESALIIVTLVSLGMAAAMGLVTWRLLRAERRRSAARIEALAQLAARDERTSPHGTERASIRSTPVTPESDPLDRPLWRAPTAPGAAVSAEPSPEVARAGGDLFSVADSPDRSRRLLAFGAAVVVVAGVVAVLVTFGRSAAIREPASAGRTAPLELLSLQHAKQDAQLTVSGLVLNPADGRQLRGVVAVAVAFDQAGEVIGSGRAPLEFPQLAPGSESSFQVTIANASAAGRYRISFRTGDGGVLGHVDRRAGAVTAPAGPASTPARTSLATAAGNR